MAIFKSTTTSTNLQQLQSARPKDNTTATDKGTDSNIPNQIIVGEQQDDSDTTHTIFGFDKLLNCWGAGLSCDDYAQAEEDRKQALQVEAAKAEMKKLKEAQEAKEAAIARRKQFEAAQAKKAAAVEKSKKVRDLALETADAKVRLWEDAKEAADARQEQAKIDADQAKRTFERNTKEAAEARRLVKKAILAKKMAKKEANKSNKMAKKEAKKADWAKKDAQVKAKKAEAARKQYAKVEAAVSKKAAKEEAKKAAEARKLVKQLEEEEKQIREAEENIGSLKKKLKAAAASGNLQGIVLDDSQTVRTEDDDSTKFSEMSEADLKNVLSDMLEEASMLLRKK